MLINDELVLHLTDRPVYSGIDSFLFSFLFNKKGHLMRKESKLQGIELLGFSILALRTTFSLNYNSCHVIVDYANAMTFVGALEYWRFFAYHLIYKQLLDRLYSASFVHALSQKKNCKLSEVTCGPINYLT
jgi:hypothetical protein